MPSSRRRWSIRSKRTRRASRWAASLASNASSPGSIPNPRMWSSPSHSPRSRGTMALISTPGRSVIPVGTAAVATTSRYPARLSWSVIASRRTPTSNAWRTSSAGATIPSERVVWVWRSIVEGPGGTTRSGPAGTGSWRSGLAVDANLRPTSGLDESLDSLDGERPARGGVDVDLHGVEDDRPRAHLEARRQRVDEPGQHRPRFEPDDAPDRSGHADVRQVRRAAGQDPLVAGDDVGVGARDEADPPVQIEAQRVLLGRQLAVEVDEADRWERLRRLVEEPVRVREGVLDLGHVRAALQVDDGDVAAVERLVGAPATARDLVGAVVERPEHAVA